MLCHCLCHEQSFTERSNFILSLAFYIRQMTSFFILSYFKLDCCNSTAVTWLDTRCPPKTISSPASETLAQWSHIKVHFTFQFTYKHTGCWRSTWTSSPLPKDHPRSCPARLRFSGDDPDGRGFHKVPVHHLVLFSPGHRLKFRGGFRAPVCHKLILCLAVVHHHLLRLLPKQPVWETERKRKGRTKGTGKPEISKVFRWKTFSVSSDSGVRLHH